MMAKTSTEQQFIYADRVSRVYPVSDMELEMIRGWAGTFGNGGRIRGLIDRILSESKFQDFETDDEGRQP